MTQLPAKNDTKDILWKKIAWNLYEVCVIRTITGLTPPSWNDNTATLQKKATYYSAALASQ